MPLLQAYVMLIRVAAAILVIELLDRPIGLAIFSSELGFHPDLPSIAESRRTRAGQVRQPAIAIGALAVIVQTRCGKTLFAYVVVVE